MNSVLPDSSGNIGTSRKKPCRLCEHQRVAFQVAQLNATISKSFASTAMEGLHRDRFARSRRRHRGVAVLLPDGTQGPIRVWRAPYNCGLVEKPGQNQIGCGTTPTCSTIFKATFRGYHRQRRVHARNVYSRDSGKLWPTGCLYSARDAECVREFVDRGEPSIIVETITAIEPASTQGAKVTTPGINRVDFDPATGKSSVVWANNSIAVPSVVSQLSTAMDGLHLCQGRRRVFWAPWISRPAAGQESPYINSPPWRGGGASTLQLEQLALPAPPISASLAPDGLARPDKRCRAVPRQEGLLSR